MIDNETAMVHLAWRVGLLVGTVAVIAAALLRGLAGALTAAGSVILVVGLFGLTGLSLRWAARRGPTTVRAVTFGGLFVRLWLYGVLLVTLSPTHLVDRPTIVLTAPLALLTLLAAEVRLVLREPSFWWVEPHPAGADRKDRA